MLRLGLLFSLLLMLTVSCGCGGNSQSTQTPSDDEVAQRLRLFTGLLEQELEQLGKDINHVVATAPVGDSNIVFDLDGDTVGNGIQLTWTEQLVGDFDQNSEVGGTDIQPLAFYYLQNVSYDPASEHGGVENWPSGDPESDGITNWRKARVDGDSNTEINQSDIAVIAQHFGESLSGYRVYRQSPGTSTFSLLENPNNATSQLTVPRSEAQFDNSSPVRYTFVDETATNVGVYRYRIAPFDQVSGEEGPTSVEVSVDTSVGINASFTATPTTGRAPLVVQFDASDSSAIAGITRYDWDFDGDSTFDEAGTSATTQHTYASVGTYQATLQITDNDNNTDTSAVQISVVENVPPTASFTANPTSGSAPLNVSFDASSSTDTDGSITQYEWDYDGDFTFDDTNTIPTTSHQYTTDGNYTVTLRVTDNEGATNTTNRQITVETDNNPPEAVLQANPYSGAPALKVTFYSSSSSDSDGTIVQREYDWEGDGTYDETGNEQIVQHWYNDEGTYNPVLRVTDNLGATDTDTVVITVSTGPIPPVADLVLSTNEGNPTLDVNFDASGSTAPGGSITQYEWDWEGDGTYDESGVSPTTMHSYTDPGYYSPTVRVTDDSALTDEASDNVLVHGWAIVTVDDNGDTGKYSSIAMIDGNPAVSYYRFAKGLVYCRAVNEYGGVWDEPVLIEGYPAQPDNYYTGQHTNLESVNGRPAIAYVDNSPGYKSLKYVRANDTTGESWGTVQTLVSHEAMSSDLEVIDGYPAISYRDVDTDALMYVRANNADGSSWSSPVTIATNGGGYDLQMLVVSGNPAVAYCTDTSHNLYYVRANDATGSSWPASSLVIDNTDHAGQILSIDVVNGNPAIFYSWRHLEIGNTYELDYYIRANDTTGSTWGTRQLLQSPGNIVYGGLSLCVFEGVPVLGYANKGSHSVEYQVGTDANGSSWGSVETISASTGTNVESFTIGEVNGKLAVIYYNSNNAHMTYGVLL